MRDLNDLEIDLQEVVLVDQSQFVTVNVAQIKELEKVAEDCKVHEQKIKEFERIVNEMKQNEKQNQLVSFKAVHLPKNKPKFNLEKNKRSTIC